MMIATVERKNRKYKVGEFDYGKTAYEACQKFIVDRGWNNGQEWNGCKITLENTDEECERTLKI